MLTRSGGRHNFCCYYLVMRQHLDDADDVCDCAAPGSSRGAPPRCLLPPRRQDFGVRAEGLGSRGEVQGLGPRVPAPYAPAMPYAILAYRITLPPCAVLTCCMLPPYSVLTYRITLPAPTQTPRTAGVRSPYHGRGIEIGHRPTRWLVLTWNIIPRAGWYWQRSLYAMA
eukprot:1354238-Rhodomonas_salina.1